MGQPSSDAPITPADAAPLAASLSLHDKIALAARDHRFLLLDPAAKVLGTLMRHEPGGVQEAGSQWCWTNDEDSSASGKSMSLLEKARAGGRAEHQGHFLRSDGTRGWKETTIYAAEDGCFAVIERDLSLRHEADLALETQREALGAVLYSTTDAVISVDPAGRVTLFTPAAERIFGHSAKSMLGQPLDMLLPLTERSHHAGHLAGFAESRVTQRAMGAGRVKGLHAEGHEIDLEASISQATVRGQKVLTAIVRDVTVRVRSEVALAQYQLELSALTRQLMAQEKSTTKRVAQTLHDHLGQTLTALRLTFDALSAGLSAPPASPQEALIRQIGTHIDHAIRDVRQVLVDLRPPLLDEHGLVAALESELRMRAGAYPAISIVLEAATELSYARWPSDVEYATFMIAREAVGNALAHADSSEVRVLLAGSSRAITLAIVDDGRGLPTDGSLDKPGHLGMVGMRERAAAIGGRFTAASMAGRGSRIELDWACAE